MVRQKEIHLRRPGTGQSAQSIVELMAGLLVMVPILLFLVDMGVLVIANILNGDLSKTTARAAAMASDGATAKTSATTAVSNFNTSGIIKQCTLTYLDWRDPNAGADTPQVSVGALPNNYPNAQPGQVMAVTQVTVAMPIPFPFLPATSVFQAYSIQPIVALKPNLPGNAGP